jgi:tRNA pseudouridine38-40 synthase
MVRVIMGTLLWVGEGKMASSEIKRILEGRNRSLAGPTAMPHGLMLIDVEYSSEKQG